MKSLKRFAAIVLSVMISCSTAASQGQSVDSQDKSERKFTSLHKSLLVPGWGQASEKRYLEGAVFFASELAILYEIFRLSHKSNKQYALYKAATSAEDALMYRDLTIKSDKRRNQMMIVAVGVWAVNLIHVSAVVKRKEEKKAKLDVKLHVNKNQALSICIHYHY